MNSIITEEWKPIKGYEGLYEVSNMGNIKSLPKRHGTHYQKQFVILKGSSDKDGYWRVTLRKDSKSKTIKVHRLVAEAFIDNPERLPQVNHIDGNKVNNHADNLEWCTCQENITHAVKTGLRGEPYQKKIGISDSFKHWKNHYISILQRCVIVYGIQKKLYIKN